MLGTDAVRKGDLIATSSMLALGSPAPPFDLTDTRSGESVSMDDFSEAAGLLVMFICNHCPYVRHIRGGLSRLGRDYEHSGIAIVAISSNDPMAYPTDDPDEMRREARLHDYRFPYLFDETQQVAMAYTAVCTPDFFLFGPDRTLAYRGRFDESRPNSSAAVTGADLRAAMDAVLAGRRVPEQQYPSMGCSIKWKAANAPDSFGA